MIILKKIRIISDRYDLKSDDNDNIIMVIISLITLYYFLSLAP